MLRQKKHLFPSTFYNYKLDEDMRQWLATIKVKDFVEKTRSDYIIVQCSFGAHRQISNI